MSPEDEANRRPAGAGASGTGERHFEQTINELLDVLDRDTVVAAVEEMQSRRQARRAARRTRSRRARPKNIPTPIFRRCV